MIIKMRCPKCKKYALAPTGVRTVYYCVLCGQLCKKESINSSGVSEPDYADMGFQLLLEAQTKIQNGQDDKK